MLQSAFSISWAVRSHKNARIAYERENECIFELNSCMI